MFNTGSFLLASVYSGFSPLMNTAAASCSLNGQDVPCAAGFVGGLVALVGGIWIVFFAMMILMVVSLWKIYVKAGRPGWASLIPVYNLVVLLEVVNKPTWWVILTFIPVVNVVIGIMVLYNLAKIFGKGAGFTLGLVILPFIFYPILAFGKSAYLGSAMPPINAVPAAL